MLASSKEGLKKVCIKAVRNLASTNAKSSKDLGKKVCKKCSKELGKEICQKSRKELGKKVCKKSSGELAKKVCKQISM